MDRSKFGDGYITEAEKKDKFIFSEGGVKYDEKVGAGGAVPTRGYKGPWPVFGTEKDSWEAIQAMILRNSSSSATSSDTTSSDASTRPRMMCRSTGRCSACSKKELQTPYCQPYGNRKPIECRPIAILEEQTHQELLKPSLAESKQASSRPPLVDTQPGIQPNMQPGMQSDIRPQTEHRILERQEPVVSSILYKGYQNCGRDQIQETWDYSEFVALNLILALAGLMLLLNRQRKLAGQHRAMLARRIGRI